MAIAKMCRHTDELDALGLAKGTATRRAKLAELQKRCDHAWTVRWHVKTNDGWKSAQKVLPRGLNKRQALQEEHKLLAGEGKTRGEVPADTESAGRRDFRGAAADWLSYKRAMGKWSANSARIYANALREDGPLDTYLGGYPVGGITKSDVQKLLARLWDGGDGLGTSSLETIRRVIFMVLSHAGVPADAAKAEMPGEKGDRGRGARNANRYLPTADEIDAIADNMPADMRLFVYLGAECGLRPGEILAAHKDNLKEFTIRNGRERKGYRLAVREQFQNLRDGNGPQLTRLKHKGRDDGRMTPVTAKALAEWQRHMADHGTTHAGYLFANPDDQRFLRAFHRAVEKARSAYPEIPEGYTGHGLRHYFCTVAQQNGVPLSALARFVGHADLNLLYETYYNTSDRDYADAADALGSTRPTDGTRREGDE
jgi:integrase